MDEQTQPRRSGSYTANLLGNIRSHLAGLQCYDVRALEFIQNGDDAKAESVDCPHREIPRYKKCGCLGIKALEPLMTKNEVEG